MIQVTRLDGSEFIINSDLIETIEATPDTVITFAHDKKVVIREAPDDVVERIVQFRRRVYADPSALIGSPGDRPTPEQTSHQHRGIGSPGKRFRIVHQDEQHEHGES
jgi:flagellar protein FlbD